MNYKYAFQKFDTEKMARALGRGLPISIKHSVELANAIRGMRVERAKTYLEEVISLKQPVKFTRFNMDLGHKKKIGPARYPVKTAENFLKILKLVEANAVFKGLSVQDLVLIHVCAHKAEGRWHFGRQRRRQFKSSHLEMVVQEMAAKKERSSKSKKKNAEAKPAKVDEKKQSAPVVEKKEAPKQVKVEGKKPEPKVEIKKEEPKPVPKTESKSTETKPEEKKEVPKQVKVEEKKSESKAEIKKEESKSPNPEDKK